MRRVLSLAVAGFFVLAAADQARAQTFVATADLNGGNETPAVITGAGGFATVTLDASANTVSWVIDVYNLPSGVTAGHIHVGSPGVGGPTVINFVVPTPASNDFRITGSAVASDLTPRAPQGINSFDDFKQAFLNGDLYVNIHTQVNPGGEIRGPLVLRP